MLDIIKMTLLTWFTIFFMIFLFVGSSLWVLTSIWWIITNTMIDRDIFLLMSTSLSFVISILVIIVSLNSSEK